MEPESRALQLLLVENCEDDANLILREFTQAGYEVTAERVDTVQALLVAVSRRTWDLVIAEYAMPELSGIAALAVVRERDENVPVIFVSSISGEDVAVAAVKMGADDYIMKTTLGRLVPAAEREIRAAETRRSRKQAERRLVHLAYHDPLTDLPNRVLLYDRLLQGILAASRSKESLSLMVLDLDGFKAVNDSLGHVAGDRLLQEVARRLRSLLRDVDTVARLGGDEFAFLLPRTDRDGAELTARKVVHTLRRPLALGGRLCTVAGSVGIATFPEHAATPDELLERADFAMYQAKRNGSYYAVFEPGHAPLTRRGARAV
jgi:diguanylate cyclase (GGDEF)-like protein